MAGRRATSGSKEPVLLRSSRYHGAVLPPRIKTLVLSVSLFFVLEMASRGDKVRVIRSTLWGTGNGS